ncbi:hypothetical protein ACFO1V_10870 [Daeguia caeni]|uniref:Uncharacterized protein n=1 Tax=Daeguia caeni TaxID=439612 RepID=A0ABV9H5Q5_9HYPH
MLKRVTIVYLLIMGFAVIAALFVNQRHTARIEQTTILTSHGNKASS